MNELRNHQSPDNANYAPVNPEDTLETQEQYFIRQQKQLDEIVAHFNTVPLTEAGGVGNDYKMTANEVVRKLRNRDRTKEVYFVNTKDNNDNFSVGVASNQSARSCVDTINKKGQGLVTAEVIEVPEFHRFDTNKRLRASEYCIKIKVEKKPLEKRHPVKVDNNVTSVEATGPGTEAPDLINSGDAASVLPVESTPPTPDNSGVYSYSKGDIPDRVLVTGSQSVVAAADTATPEPPDDTGYRLDSSRILDRVLKVPSDQGTNTRNATTDGQYRFDTSNIPEPIFTTSTLNKPAESKPTVSSTPVQKEVPVEEKAVDSTPTPNAREKSSVEIQIDTLRDAASINDIVKALQALSKLDFVFEGRKAGVAELIRRTPQSIVESITAAQQAALQGNEKLFNQLIQEVSGMDGIHDKVAAELRQRLSERIQSVAAPAEDSQLEKQKEINRKQREYEQENTNAISILKSEDATIESVLTALDFLQNRKYVFTVKIVSQPGKENVVLSAKEIRRGVMAVYEAESPDDVNSKINDVTSFLGLNKKMYIQLRKGWSWWDKRTKPIPPTLKGQLSKLDFLF